MTTWILAEVSTWGEMRARTIYRRDFSGPQRFLALPGGLGNELAHLLLDFGGVALGTGDLAGFVILEAHNPDKLFATFGADVFIGRHGSPPEPRSNS
jgi:hypothetical protein